MIVHDIIICLQAESIFEYPDGKPEEQSTLSSKTLQTHCLLNYIMYIASLVIYLLYMSHVHVLVHLEIGSTISSFFGGGSSSKEDEKKGEQEEGEEVAADGDGNETTSTSDSHSTKEAGSEEKATEEEPQADSEGTTEEEDNQTEGE